MRAFLTTIGLAALVALTGAVPAWAGQDDFDVLVFSKTTGFRHGSIETGIETIKELGSENGFRVEATENAAIFNKRDLERFEVVTFLSTTGTILEDGQRRAMMRWVRRGGGFVGIHSAADTEYGWPFYERLVGAYFLSHPLEQTATIVTEDSTHPASSHLEPRFTIFEEFYSFQTNPRPNVHVLLSIDESTYMQDPNTSNLPGNTPSSGVMGDHPMSWCHDNNPGRRGKPGGWSFYTALGHEGYLYGMDWYRQHILGGILTAAKAVEADCSPTGAP